MLPPIFTPSPPSEWRRSDSSAEPDTKVWLQISSVSHTCGAGASASPVRGGSKAVVNAAANSSDKVRFRKCFIFYSPFPLYKDNIH